MGAKFLLIERCRMMSRRCRWLAIILAALAVIVAALAFMTGLSVRRSRLPGEPFDAVAWQDEVKIEQGVRRGMADRLVAEGTLIGKTRAEVVELLGEPTPIGYFADWHMVYWLGNERGSSASTLSG